MNVPFLIDSTIYIDLLRAEVDVRQKLLPALREGVLYNCGVVRAEIMRGMKHPRRREEMEAFFDIIPEVPTDARIWRQVSGLGWDLGRKGKWPPVTDLTIAACAMRVRATLISTDAHFKDIPGLSLQSELPEF